MSWGDISTTVAIVAAVAGIAYRASSERRVGAKVTTCRLATTSPSDSKVMPELGNVNRMPGDRAYSSSFRSRARLGPPGGRPDHPQAVAASHSVPVIPSPLRSETQGADKRPPLGSARSVDHTERCSCAAV